MTERESSSVRHRYVPNMMKISDLSVRKKMDGEQQTLMSNESKRLKSTLSMFLTKKDLVHVISSNGCFNVIRNKGSYKRFPKNKLLNLVVSITGVSYHVIGGEITDRIRTINSVTTGKFVLDILKFIDTRLSIFKRDIARLIRELDNYGDTLDLKIWIQQEMISLQDEIAELNATNAEFGNLDFNREDRVLPYTSSVSSTIRQLLIKTNDNIFQVLSGMRCVERIRDSLRLELEIKKTNDARQRKS